MDAEKPEKTAPQFVRTLLYCPLCGEALQAEYLRYNHIGLDVLLVLRLPLAGARLYRYRH